MVDENDNLVCSIISLVGKCGKFPPGGTELFKAGNIADWYHYRSRVMNHPVAQLKDLWCCCRKVKGQIIKIQDITYIKLLLIKYCV